MDVVCPVLSIMQGWYTLHLPSLRCELSQALITKQLPKNLSLASSIARNTIEIVNKPCNIYASFKMYETWIGCAARLLLIQFNLRIGYVHDYVGFVWSGSGSCDSFIELSWLGSEHGCFLPGSKHNARMIHVALTFIALWAFSSIDHKSSYPRIWARLLQLREALLRLWTNRATFMPLSKCMKLELVVQHNCYWFSLTFVSDMCMTTLVLCGVAVAHVTDLLSWVDLDRNMDVVCLVPSIVRGWYTLYLPSLRCELSQALIIKQLPKNLSLCTKV